MEKRRTTQERLADLKKQQVRKKEKYEKAQRLLKAQERKLNSKARSEAQKRRTHRLIEVGGVVESICHLPIEKEDLPRLIGFLRHQEKSGFYFSKAMGYDHSVEQNGQINYSLRNNSQHDEDKEE